MTDENTDPGRERDVADLTDDEVNGEIEESCWSSHQLVMGFSGGIGSMEERRAALQAAFDIERENDTRWKAQLAFNTKESEDLDALYETLQALAVRRQDHDPTKSLGDHIRDLARGVDIHLAALADTIDTQSELSSG